MEVVLEPVVSELVDGLFKILGSKEVRDFARQLVGGVDSEIKELENKLRMVEDLLRNAEDRQLMDKRVKEWLDNLQHWAYDAEDVMDEFAYEALRHKRKAEHQASYSKVFSCLPASFSSPLFAVQMGSKIKKINSRLEKLRQQRSAERELQTLPGLPPTNIAAPQKPEETSSVPLGQVYGRNEDEVELLKMVKSGANFQLIAVVGVGGIGKTTIAREVYNHKELEDIKFDKKAWVEYIEWEKLKSAFAAGALGSTMIVTTRHTDVAQTIRCSHTYQLKLLSDEACKSLFKEHAFGTGAAANADQVSISIYDRVVKRCKGLPLAAKTFGCLLHSRPSNTWEEILESKIWSAFDECDHILPTLKLSYHYLPLNLKRCFGYCAIFPQDYEFEEKELALLWIAEGIVQPSNKQLDEAGYNLEDLKSLSFLQELYISKLQNVTNPNQVREQILSNKNNLKVLLLEWEYEENSLKADVEMKLLDKLKPLSNLKELTIQGYGCESFQSWLGDWSWLCNLVVLILEECKRCTSLPSLEMLSSLEDLTIKDMVGLKRIDFRTPFKSLKFLYFENLIEWEHWDNWRENDDIENFPKLRVLLIITCPKLTRKIPDYLSLLERLFIWFCPKLVVSFSNYPIHCKLEIDDCEGMVCNDGSIDFKWLDSRYLANIPTVEDKLKKGSQSVDLLKIVCNEEIIESWQSLENINFLSNINYLEIRDCQNLRSIGRGMLPLSLKSLRIDHCEELKFLEDLSVSLLERLWISECGSLKCISLDGPLPETLNQLDVGGCKALETLSSSRNSLHHLPCLESIKIDGCPKLSVREGVPTSLRQLLINECEDDKGMGIEELPQLKSISDLTNLTALESGVTSLTKLYIEECQKLKSIPSLSGLTSLQELTIATLPQLESIQDLSNLTSLEDLQISKCPRIKSIPSLSGLTPLQELRIADLPQLESIQDLSNLTSLEDLQISKCLRIKSIPSLSSLTSLTGFKIEECPSLISIPHLSSLTSLQSLRITECPLLIKRWKSVTGKYSSKIAQIPKVVIDGKFIYNLKEYEVDRRSSLSLIFLMAQIRLIPSKLMINKNISMVVCPEDLSVTD
ncbi:putative disease resistance protein RGA1 [Mangifera indica]|uniref:putative disease resistance protein RGA1 n=1 Tax=Mangifera indica TaxID=29780 RepID=UPI001CFC07F7|nr:putative disease resistance protein RGA1 [Mangifera indica]